MEPIHHIIIDTDPGIDDAVAIAAALFHDQIDVKLITTVAGNVSCDKTTNNALKLLEFFHSDVPVAQGAIKPLLRTLEDSSHIHGNSGLDGYDFPHPKKETLGIHAIEAMRETILSSKEPITLVPIGPLTNIALLLSVYPECKQNIKRIVFMGGSASRGNHSPAAEFNMFVDPEAAKIVLQSGLDITMCGLDVTSLATLTKENVEALKEMNRTGEMLYGLFQHYRGGSLATGLHMHDLCAIAYLVKPELFVTKKCFVDVEVNGSYTAGATIVDLKSYYQQQANAKVCLEIRVEEFRQWFMEIFTNPSVL
ncbi:ribonucleoside hydrolase RihC [Brevibacillus halotolerans]|uniref:ribonucleoside hydrolase RihC n=1 Tax=Brevibacillus TaxID=55080 RepID=UPI00215D0F0C|nr:MULTISPECIES: ribonucleoside hydrolase RihC [Brevibacillus]MCR8963177.1 ribonucleoside hydrolase RihC [Brevibacillus laterosporus]MCZ0835333.1 ribonucleoside hydrolase RihC [Brevibacillus halotolerans]